MRILGIILLMVCALCAETATAQWQRASVDTVRMFVPGTGQSSGQGPAFYPVNIFGPPDPTASDSVAAVDPRQICSIGLGGTIEIGFKEFVITDGPGSDFTIFENAFKYGKNKVYSEPGSVEVSQNGITWKAFPFDTSFYKGCAGVTPTSGKDPFNPELSGGDSFDLSAIGVDSIRWIRITDITPSLLSQPQSPLYDPTLTGFDLDAVVTWHAVPASNAAKLVETLPSGVVRAYVKDANSMIRVVDVSGRLIDEYEITVGIHDISTLEYPRGAYMFSLISSSGVFTMKVLK